MATIARKFCTRCNDYVAAERVSTSHLIHFVLTLITAGLWLPVWIFIALTKGHRCRQCGSATTSTNPKTIMKLILVMVIMAGGVLLYVSMNIDRLKSANQTTAPVINQ